MGLLAVHNVVGNLWLPGWAYVPVNLTSAAVLLWLALGTGTHLTEITGPAAWLGRGVVAGVALGGSAAALIALAAAVPAARDAFADDRVLGVGGAGLAYHALVRIPLGTALFEEVAFRGVLPALGRTVTAPRRADLGSAALFGLWHVIPASSAAAGNEVASGFASGVVVTVAALATAAAGIGFTWLRNRFGIAAPILLHAAINSGAFAAAWAIA